VSRVVLVGVLCGSSLDAAVLIVLASSASSVVVVSLSISDGRLVSVYVGLRFKYLPRSGTKREFWTFVRV